MILNSVSCLIMAIWFNSCKPESPPEPIFSPPGAIVWKYEREYKSLASTNYIYQNLYIQGINSVNDEFKVVAVTLDSGKFVWQTENLANDVFFNPFGVEYSAMLEDKLVFSDRGKTCVIDANSGNVLWQDILPNGDFGACIIEDHVFVVTETQEISELYRYNLSTGQRKIIFSISKDAEGNGKFEPALCMPVKWVAPNGNELLILHSRGWDGTDYRMDVMAWNLTADSMEWYRKGLSDRASSSRPVIEDNRVYLFSISKVYCVDAQTGNTIWQFEKDPADNFSGFKTANILLVKDKIIAKSDSYWIYGLDKMSGKRLWANSNTAPMPYLLREYKDTIWYSSGGVYAIDANSGQTLIEGWDNNGKGPFWSNPVVHHPTLGYIYTTDGDYIYCLDPSKMK